MGRSPFQNFHLFVINKLEGWGNPTLILLTTFLRECVKMGRWGVVVVGGKHACKGHAVSSSSMGVLLMLLLFATVVSSSDVDGLSDVEGGEALPQSHAASGLLQSQITNFL